MFSLFSKLHRTSKRIPISRLRASSYDRSRRSQRQFGIRHASMLMTLTPSKPAFSRRYAADVDHSVSTSREAPGTGHNVTISDVIVKLVVDVPTSAVTDQKRTHRHFPHTGHSKSQLLAAITLHRPWRQPFGHQSLCTLIGVQPGAGWSDVILRSISTTSDRPTSCPLTDGSSVSRLIKYILPISLRE